MVDVKKHHKFVFEKFYRRHFDTRRIFYERLICGLAENAQYGHLTQKSQWNFIRKGKGASHTILVGGGKKKKTGGKHREREVFHKEKGERERGWCFIKRERGNPS